MRRAFAVRGILSDMPTTTITVDADGAPQYILVYDRMGRPTLLYANRDLIDCLASYADSGRKEHYSERIFVFDVECQLLAVLTPSCNPAIPARVIVEDITGIVHDIGPEDPIDICFPDALIVDDWIDAMEEALASHGVDLRTYLI